MKLAFGLIEQRAIDVFNRDWFKIEKLDRCLHCIAHRCEEDEAQTFLAGQGRDPEFGGKDRSKSSFAAGENVREIVRSAQESFDTVARPALDQSRRPAFSHFGPDGA